MKMLKALNCRFQLYSVIFLKVCLFVGNKKSLQIKTSIKNMKNLSKK
jgi:hypothetical protein